MNDLTLLAQAVAKLSNGSEMILEEFEFLSTGFPMYLPYKRIASHAVGIFDLVEFDDKTKQFVKLESMSSTYKDEVFNRFGGAGYQTKSYSGSKKIGFMLQFLGVDKPINIFFKYRLGDNGAYTVYAKNPISRLFEEIYHRGAGVSYLLEFELPKSFFPSQSTEVNEIIIVNDADGVKEIYCPAQISIVVKSAEIKTQLLFQFATKDDIDAVYKSITNQNTKITALDARIKALEAKVGTG